MNQNTMLAIPGGSQTLFHLNIPTVAGGTMGTMISADGKMQPQKSTFFVR